MPCSLLEELKTKYGLLRAESPYANFKVPSLKQTYEFFGFEWDIVTPLGGAVLIRGKQRVGTFEADYFTQILQWFSRLPQILPQSGRGANFVTDISVSAAWASEGKEEDQFSDFLDELLGEEQVFELTTGVPSLSGLHAAVYVCKQVRAAS